METIGWIGSWSLAVCGLPQAIKCIKDGNASGMSWEFILLWFIGEIFTLVYILQQNGLKPLIANYSLNVVFTLIILYIKVRDEFKKDT